jgi:hypothetical protein
MRTLKCLRQTFALGEKYADFENVCAKALRLMKKYADFEKGVKK